MFLPFIYNAERTASDVAAGGLGPLDAVRGGGPLVLVVVARALAAPARRGHGSTELVLGAFIGLAGLSFLWAARAPEQTALKAIQIIAAYLAVVALVRMYESTEDAVRGLATAIHVSLLAVAAEAVLFPQLTFASGDGSTGARLGGVVPAISANPLALYGVAGIAAILFRLGPRVLVGRGFARVTLFCIYVAIVVATGTRTASIVGILLIVLAAIRVANQRPALVVFGPLIVAAATFAWWSQISGAAGEFLSRGQSAQQVGTLTGRTEIWEKGLRASADERLLGLGYYTGHRLSIPGLPPEQSNLDSTWIETLVDLGGAGLVAISAFAVLGLWRLIRTPMPTMVKRWSVLVAVSGAVVSLINPTLQSPGPLMLLLSFLLLAPMHGGRAASTRVARTRPRSAPLRMSDP